MRYLLDTNTCIFIMKQVPSAMERLRAAHASGVAISTVTLAELEYGVEKSAARERNAKNLLAFSTLVEILPFDIPASSVYGQIRAALEKRGTPIGTLDMLIAAHAKSLGLTLVTNNIKEFGRVEELAVEDWLR
jgi:tRNA(fMet)-specific endonuclease VapC